MSTIATYGRGLVLYVRLRRITALALIGVVMSIGITQAVTLANLRGDPGIPPTRLALLLGCACAGLQLLMVRGVLPDGERLAAISIKTVRLTLFVSVQLACFGATALAGVLASTEELNRTFHAAAVTAMLSGMALLAGRWSTYAGLMVPWLYVVTGLMVGYDSPVSGGSATVRPWAWLVDDSSPILSTVVLAAVVTLVAAALDPLRPQTPDDV